MDSVKKTKIGPFLIMIASSLWAIDGLFRTQLTYAIPTASIIFFEHLLGTLILLPILYRNVRWIRSYSMDTWKTLLLLTLVSSVLGTILFTQALASSFAYNDFVTPILLQKLQPIFVVLLSAIFLKERITPQFVFWASLALVGSYLVSFGTTPVSLDFTGRSMIYLLAIGAAFCWGTGTILSKKVLTKIEFPVATALRFLLAVPISAIFIFALGESYDFSQIPHAFMYRFLIIAGVTGGAGAIFLYYRGLQVTKAHVATFAELAFPVVSILIAVTPLNPYGAPQVLSLGNILGIIVLVGSILMISFSSHNTEKTQ
ncbi:DMT family transporter [Candidatus Woesebacteria bacterium]|nr:DMT family transporter [Candidatus Woesebacteria bacterium]